MFWLFLEEPSQQEPADNNSHYQSELDEEDFREVENWAAGVESASTNSEVYYDEENTNVWDKIKSRRIMNNL